MDAARKLAQLAERGIQAHGEPVDQRPGLGVADRRAQHAQLEGEREQLLLGAVVEVALDAPAGVVGGLDDAQPRDAQILHACAQVRLQPLVVDRQRRRRGGSEDELGARVERRVVDDGRYAAPVLLDGRPRASRSGLGQHDGVAGLVDEGLAIGQPVGDRHRAVAQALGQHLAHRPARRSARRQQRARRSCTAACRGRRGSPPPAPRPPGRAPAARGRGRGRAATAPGSRWCRGRRRPGRRGSGSPRAAPAGRAPRRTGRRSAAAWWRAARPSATGPGLRGRPAIAATGCPPSPRRRAGAGCGCRGSGWPRGGRAGRASGRRPRRPAAAANRSRPRSARRRAPARPRRSRRGSRSAR